MRLVAADVTLGLFGVTLFFRARHTLAPTYMPLDACFSLPEAQKMQTKCALECSSLFRSS